MSQATHREALSALDPSQPGRFADGSWRETFARLRADDPVHYCADSPTGPYWSVTRHGDIKAVDMNHQLFSSEVGGITIAEPELDEAIRLDNFIAMDEPKHSAQRKAVAPSVAPTNLARLEPLIRERVVDILEHLPVGTPFNWVPAVSVELTARMLATLFEFPYEDRHKLIHWSDITTASPELMGEAGVTRDVRAVAFKDCAETFMGLWNDRAGKPPQADLISMLVHGESTRDMHTRPTEFLGNIMLLIVGGQRHHAELHQRRGPRPESTARRNGQAAERPNPHPQHGGRDDPLAVPSHPHAPHGAGRRRVPRKSL